MEKYILEQINTQMELQDLAFIDSLDYMDDLQGVDPYGDEQADDMDDLEY